MALQTKMTPAGEPVLQGADVRQQRRAIVFADLVESVRLMQDHEADAIERWRCFVAETRERLLPALAARLVRTAGDGLLIECEKPAQAVATAFAIHTALRGLNVGRADDERMWLRVGIHEANVVFDEFEV
jgi:adenylate cyclase